jgi:hypothetical protein
MTVAAFANLAGHIACGTALDATNVGSPTPWNGNFAGDAEISILQ